MIVSSIRLGPVDYTKGKRKRGFGRLFRKLLIRKSCTPISYAAIGSLHWRSSTRSKPVTRLACDWYQCYLVSDIDPTHLQW